MPTCTSCKKNRPIWFRKSMKPSSYRNLLYCMSCFNNILSNGKLVQKLLLSKQKQFIQKPYYWGISNERAIVSILTSQWLVGQFLFWEFWNSKTVSLVQVVSYLRARSLLDYHWYIVPLNNLLYVTKNYKVLNRENSFTSYRFALSFIQTSHVKEIHAEEEKCTCIPLSKYGQRTETYTVKRNTWTLFDLSSFTLRNNLFNLDLSLFHRLPEHITSYVATYDPTSKQTN